MRSVGRPSLTYLLLHTLFPPPHSPNPFLLFRCCCGGGRTEGRCQNPRILLFWSSDRPSLRRSEGSEQVCGTMHWAVVCALPPPSPVLKIAHSFARYAPTLERELTNGATEKTRKRSRREGGCWALAGAEKEGRKCLHSWTQHKWAAAGKVWRDE